MESVRDRSSRGRAAGPALTPGAIDERGLSRPTDNLEERCPEPELLLSPRVGRTPAGIVDRQQFVEHEVALLDEQRIEERLTCSC